MDTPLHKLGTELLRTRSPAGQRYPTLEMALAVAIPIVAGYATAHLQWGVIAAFGAMIPLARAYNAALGVAVITTVVMLLLDLLPTVAGVHGLFAARFYDTLVGCILVLLGDWIAVSRLR